MLHHPSANHEPRKNGLTPQFVVLHGTWTRTVEESLKFLTDTDPAEGFGRVSAHYLIDKNGDVYNLVDEGQRAWHAGLSFWRGVEDMNSASVGIELQNYGMKDISPDPYTDAQMAALADLLKGIMARHGMPPENIIAHSDIAPTRKDDPGEHFPWRMLAKENLAVWPDENRANPDMVAELLADEGALLNALQGWGYDASLDLRTIKKAFDRHFVPEIFMGGVDDTKTLRARRLSALWQQKLGI